MIEQQFHTRAAYIEGNFLGGGWSYRINRVVKARGEVAYTAILTHEDASNGAEKLHLWLSEFATLQLPLETLNRNMWSINPEHIK